MLTVARLGSKETCSDRCSPVQQAMQTLREHLPKNAILVGQVRERERERDRETEKETETDIETKDRDRDRDRDRQTDNTGPRTHFWWGRYEALVE